MKLYLVQHGEAYKKEENPERSLTSQGREDVELVARFLKDRGIKVTKILHSTKLRARQTAEILGKYLVAPLEEVEDLEPLADPKIWAEKMKKWQDDTMIVGHLPHLSKLLSILLCSEEKEIAKFHMGGVICLERNDGWRIVFSIPPWILKSAEGRI